MIHANLKHDPAPEILSATGACQTPARDNTATARRPRQAATHLGARGMSPAKPRRAATYARVSTTDQTAQNQLLALRDFARARGWAVTEFVDSGVSGATEKRPALDAMLAAVRARRVDVVSCVKLDRLARSVHHLVAMVREFEALGVDLV